MIASVAGWMVGVLIVLEDEPQPVRHYYAVARLDRAVAEWIAADHAQTVGRIATSPHGGFEPVEAVGPLSVHVVAAMGVIAGGVMAFGSKWPRRWL